MNPCAAIVLPDDIFNSYVMSDPSDESNKLLIIVRRGDDGLYYSEYINNRQEPDKFHRLRIGLTNKKIHDL